MLREQDKHFLLSLYAGLAIICTWRGLWEGVYEIPYLGEPAVLLFIGLTMLTLSGLIFKEFDPLGGFEKSVTSALEKVMAHPEKDQFILLVEDKHNKTQLQVKASQVKEVEEDTIILMHPTKKGEMFIPLHRLEEIKYKDQSYWRF
jgi:uncharacterized protein (UPF0248 family)